MKTATAVSGEKVTLEHEFKNAVWLVAGSHDDSHD